MFIKAIVDLKVLFLNLISFQTNATTRAVSESRANVFPLKKNKPAHCFLSSPRDFPCCFSPFGARMSAQLKFSVFFGPISMKERGVELRI